ncbi:tRNA lysidine(34) synthetase TilS [Mycoplasmopsis pullorum]|uniref:tRNA lysidine(34) synthetase TilS n=1 Tax=Mycoplasmopsis pullorum TaxID=48003 RepID=UPI001117E74A|nr:tRNA lysidine(34) synthetase TilS [Mycoplasmopsis pullorum]TNK82672.1 tRNA lysidine(34) synthetase TilS [Mycoplasmopsis pullorum]TNK83444.1 tRNA lysidine(34) synthetase TilS [Mycoplasmopsis pullorum]TNK85190.1 tRNA lysidine(34) synthetase TilS [Mycoplasmopsis pullorum]TNK85691.1 tRNA lysidine(34) synthetase TilS [Mycoplasmopsis pullorum]TNK86104.1 tRNA lysidine(34) synthetase TilS [Mycoplasmopsis pullorum]
MKQENNQVILLAISGGPDSIFLLNKYINHNNIVVAHVNYNQRFNSDIDQKIVEEMCKKHNIPYEILSLKKDDYQGGNFQNWAREQRYNFFKQVYDKYQCNVLFVAHHIDDFLETYFLQKKRKSYINYWGIKKRTEIFNMNVERPLLFSYTKKQILKSLEKKKITFAVDYTNSQPKYDRNKIRLSIQNWTLIYKILFLFWIRIKNIKNFFQNRQINRILEMWEKKEFAQEFLSKLNKSTQKKLVYQFLHKRFNKINLSSSKIDSIIQFIISDNRTSKYKLSDFEHLYKIKGKVQ